MHDSTASSFIGSEDRSPSCSSSDEFGYRMPSVISSQCAGNSTLFFTDGLYPNKEMLAGPPYGCGSKEYIIDLMVLESGSGGVGAKLSEARMAARRAEEAGQRVDAIRNAKHTMNSETLQDSSSRRQQAAQWLQTMVGNLSFPANPTVEDLRVYLKNGQVLCKVINKVQPGSVPMVEDPSNPSQLDGALPNYLYYDNVKNFLVAVEDMGLPAFEATALEQGPMSSNSSAKVVDCILALKSYHDWKQGGALGFWRLKSPTGSGSCVTSSRYSNHSKNINICSDNSRRKWMLSDQESLDGTSLSSSPDQSANVLSLHKDNRATFDDIMRLDHSGRDGVDGKSDERSSSPETSASTSTWLQDIRHKFSEVLLVKAKRAQDTITPTPIVTEGQGGGAILTYDHNAPSQSLLSLISAIIGDKPAEEVPVLVEFMLRKIMEEFERHLLNQRNRVTKAINPSLSIAKMKTALKDIMVREEKLASQNMVLEALAAGTQEEIKECFFLFAVGMRELELGSEKLHNTKSAEEEMRLKEEEMDNDKRMTMQDSKHQIDNNKQLDDKRLLHFETAEKEMEMESKERVSSLQSQVTESYKKMQEMEYQSSRLKATLREKDDKWQKSLSRLLKEFKDLRWAQLDAKEEILRLQFDWKNQLKNFGEELQTLVAAASGYHKVLAENRLLYNEVQDLKGNIRVYCRVRPFLTKDSTKQTTIDYVGENGELVLANPGKPVGKDSRRSFTFNRCFDTKSLQEEVFLDTQPLIRSVLDGFNVCIFAYGQTGSGKTFTMSGPTNMTPMNWGVNYRALNDLFQITQSRVHVFRYEIGVQMLEIYNEQVRDLLVTDGSHKKLEIRNNSQLNGLNVPDANVMPVTSTDDVLELMKLGQKNRAVGSTSLNDRSSRSHSVVTVHVQGKDLESGSIFRGSLHLVDLAGSERVDKSEVTGDRLKEAQHINKSLSALGDVISALAQKNGHVPYRNSKLTQLLQDSLGGQAKTLMFVHISPDADSFGETMSTLKFAERVATVELGAARSNKESGEIQVLKDQVHQLKEVVAKKDAEIAILNQTIKEQHEKAENTANAEKVKAKPTNASKPRRHTSNEAQAQKGRKTTTENGNANAETRQSLRKTAGGKKTPTSLVLSTGHDAEDSTEQFESSSACSPLDSPTENKVQYEVSEDVAVNVFEKLKLLKSRRKGIGKHVGSFHGHHSFTEHDDVSEYVTAKPLNTAQQKGSGLVCDTTTPISPWQPEGDFTCEELNETFHSPGDDTLSSFQDYNQQSKTESNGRYVAGARKYDVALAEMGHSNQQSGLRLRLPSNMVYGLDPANGSFETVLLDTIGGGIRGQDAQDIGCKRGSFLLNSDVGLDEDFGDEEAFESRGTCQDDNASLHSDSGMSAEAENSGSSQVDQNKKVRSNSSRPQKGMSPSEVSLTPVTSTSRTSPWKADRKSTGGLFQVRSRRHKTIGPAATSDKPPPKRNPPLTGNANQEVDPASNRRLAIGATSLTTWR